ncbi:MAG: uroporphyrinogen decarboxylase family protein [Bacillota bacterium]|jgi:uroporphyrinogen decarboxylase|nr:uroporphyrinogen decarboxylase [Clostridia bacterium]
MKRNEFYLDEMTPLERSEAIAKGESYDRIPCSPSLGEQPTRLIGVTVSQYLSDPKIMAEAQIAAFKMYGQDGVGIGPDQFGLAEALGVKMRYFADDLPQVDEAYIKRIEDISKIKIINPEKDGRFPIYLEALEILQDRIGSLVKIGTGIGGPFTSAALLRGTTNFLRDMQKNPEAVHSLLDITTENILRYLEICWEKGFVSSIGEPFASNDIISPHHFQEFLLPYLKRIGNWFRKKVKKGYSLHICGKTYKIWEDIANSGATSFSLDNVEDLAEAKKIIGHRMSLKGNVPPVEVMFQGRRADIIQAAKACIRKAYDNPKGYTLGTGCRVPLDTKPENIIALMDAARVYGKMGDFGKCRKQDFF